MSFFCLISTKQSKKNEEKYKQKKQGMEVIPLSTQS